MRQEARISRPYFSEYCFIHGTVLRVVVIVFKDILTVAGYSG